MYSFASDRFMPPDDPLGRSGPTLENFLRIQPKKGDLPPPCPYGKKCTYGTKCKFNHPERGAGPHKSVSERLSEHAQRHLSARNAIEQQQHARTPLQGKSLSVPLNAGEQCMGGVGGESMRKALCRTRSNVVAPVESSNNNNNNNHYGQQPQYSYSHCQQQQQQLQPPQSMLCSSRLPSWPPTGEQGFPKSHSVENLPLENAPAFSMPSSPSQQQFGQQQQQRSMWHQQQQQQQQGPGSGLPSEDVDGVNLHRKLHRQLTLNPGGCDPRIYQIQRGMCGGGGGGAGGNGGNNSGSGSSSGHSPHRPLEPSRSSHCGPWDMQQQQQQHHHHAQHQVRG